MVIQRSHDKLLTKRQKRLAEKGYQKTQTIRQQHFDLKDIYPITNNQVKTFNSFEDGNHLVLYGCAGAGKTFCALYLAFREIFEGTSKRHKIKIIRTAQPTKSIGHLPGTAKEKLEAYEDPYKAICSDLFGRDDAYEVLKTKGIIEFLPTSFLRGTTLDDCVMIVDETQNMTYQEVRTVLTRTGDHTRIIVIGDTKQDDLTSTRYSEKSGFRDVIRVLSKIENTDMIEFDIDDIVRSGFVRSFIVAENQLGI